MQRKFVCWIAAVVPLAIASVAVAEPLPGGSLDPTTIPKYVTPLVIPPVMNDVGVDDQYSIAVRAFEQQILPGGLWDDIRPTNGRYGPAETYGYPSTPVFSYGPAGDPTPTVAPDPNSQFNYPAYTVETRSWREVEVQWRNELVADPDDCSFANPVGDADCDYIPQLLAVDQTLHWANPAMDCRDGSVRTDCAGTDPTPYTGPVPIITHVHGAHVEGHSDGYPEAWWLPAAGNIPDGYATSGTFYDDAYGGSGDRGYADFVYRQDQPATTAWYHDHTLGMTRSNVYVGPAGFWLIRGGWFDGAWDTSTWRNAVLPGPAPGAGDSVLDLNVPGASVRDAIREIPIVIQDRSFNADGSLYYPDHRAFFEGLNREGASGTGDEIFPGEPELQIDFAPTTDIAPIWNPEAFFNVMVVNGVSWPLLEVADARYRFRLLNGCNSRFLNLALFVVNSDGSLGAELPFYQIGGDQGQLPQVVQVRTGSTKRLWGLGPRWATTQALNPDQALLMTPAERFDVIVDFGGLADGTRVRLVNTGPDSPFGGFPIELDDRADTATSGQVMEFVVDHSLWVPRDAETADPTRLILRSEWHLPTRRPADNIRQVSLNEGESEVVCVDVDAAGNVVQVPGTPPSCPGVSVPFGPKEALVGVVDPVTGEGVPLKWTDDTVSMPVPVTLQDGTVLDVNVTENPVLGDTEDWEIYNFTVDAHPIHLHLVRFLVKERRLIGQPSIDGQGVLPMEQGFKDTVLAYPGQITTVRAIFDIEGLYVWHCHIVEHEDNEMMRPYVVSAP